MRSTFLGFEISRSGVLVSQKQLDITAHNISNAETAGYTRERVTTAAIDPYNCAVKLPMISGGLVGEGVNSITVEQIRSAYLDSQYRMMNIEKGYWDTKAQGLGYVENLFDELSEGGMVNNLLDFYQSLHVEHTNTVDKDIRTNMRSEAIKFTETMNYYFDRLCEYQRNQDDQVALQVKEINDMTSYIAALNKEIYSFELHGETANDLRDKRNLLLDHLSNVIDINYNYSPEGKLTVFLGSDTLIDNDTANALKVVANDTMNPVTGVADLSTVKWAATDTNATISSGKLKGIMDLRDGNTAENMGVPRIIDTLNQFARKFVEEFNAVHMQGWTLPIGSNPSTHCNFFDDYGDITTVTAGNLKLSQEILDNVNNIACSDTQIVAGADNEQMGNNVNMLKKLIAVFDSEYPGFGTMEGFLKSILVEIGSEVKHSETMSDRQTATVNSLENQRMSLSSVSLDEEMTSMLKFQHAYQAASRMLTTMDDILDQLINRMGRVGL